MHDLHEQNIVIQPGLPSERPATGSMPPRRSASRLGTSAIVMLTMLLALVFGTGLFAGWVFGSRSTAIGSMLPGSSPAATAPPVTGSGNTLDAVREAVI